MIWKPNVTVAAVINKNNKYLLVEEKAINGTLYNQPAGHLEPNESIIQAVIRETLEETSYTFTPEWLLGIYKWHSSANDTTYLRFAFLGTAICDNQNLPLDEDIVRAVWLNTNEIYNLAHRHRSPLVIKCIEDHLAGKRYSLKILAHYK
ncbi:MAG: NUDIX hydrolase [Nitrosomonadaceae bacterium]|nr:NUDIX hydrolase [Nitrosomonadaceae bacterium]|tara:strand:- start:3694 stop:4140 length:447 start_codon:yes stop_codon:yes gene_type:complete